MLAVSQESLEITLSELEEILQVAELEKQDKPQLYSRVKEQYSILQNLYSLLTVCNQVDEYLLKLEVEKDYSSETATAGLLATSSSMSLIWKHDLTQIPENLAKKIKDQKDNFNKYEKLIVKARSAPYLAEVIRCAGKVTHLTSDNVTHKFNCNVDACRSAMKEISPLIAKIKCNWSLKQAAKHIEKIEKNIVDNKRGQFKAYQKWAADSCLKAKKMYDDEKIFTDDDAKRIFKECELDQIDVSLLSPEINMLYQKMIDFILREPDADTALDFQRLLMTGIKKTLQDF